MIYSGEIVSALAYLAAYLDFNRGWLKTWFTNGHKYNVKESFLILPNCVGFATVYWDTLSNVFGSSYKRDNSWANIIFSLLVFHIVIYTVYTNVHVC